MNDVDKIYETWGSWGSNLILKETGEWIKLVRANPYPCCDDHKIRGRLKYWQLLRLRDEVLVITKDNKVFLSKDKVGMCSTDRGTYDVPNTVQYNSDIKLFSRTKIERIENQVGLSLEDKRLHNMDYYVTILDEPEDWVKENIEERYWWYGYKTNVFVILYKGEYDNQSLLNGQFYDIDEAGRFMHTIHKKAIKMYKKKYMK